MRCALSLLASAPSLFILVPCSTNNPSCSAVQSPHERPNNLFSIHPEAVQQLAKLSVHTAAELRVLLPRRHVLPIRVNLGNNRTDSGRSWLLVTAVALKQQQQGCTQHAWLWRTWRQPHCHTQLVSLLHTTHHGCLWPTLIPRPARCLLASATDRHMEATAGGGSGAS